MAATGIDLTNGNIFVTVDTEAQAVQYEARGWTRIVGDTAADTTALAEFPSYLEDFSNPVNPSFRGNGYSAETANTLDRMLLASSVSMTPAQYQLAKAFVGAHGKKVVTTYTTAIVVVSKLPVTTAISHASIYVLSEQDNVATLDSGTAHPQRGKGYVNDSDTATTWTAFVF